MSSHFACQSMGFIHHGRQFFGGKIRQAGYSPVLINKERPVHINFNPICTTGNLLSYCLKALISPADHLSTFRKI